jgi:hypothetical protein
MTTLRALVAAGFLLAVMGIVVSVPLGWALLLGIGEANPEKTSRADHTSGRLSWCRRKSCHEPQTRGSRLSLWQSRNSLFYAARIRFSGIDCPTLRAI